VAITRVSAHDANGTAATASLTVNYPAATTSGNLLIASAYSAIASTNTLAISGWTGFQYGVAGSTNVMALFYKISTGDSSATLTNGGTGVRQCLNLYEYSGANNPVILDVSPVGNGNGASNVSSPFTLSSITTPQATDLIFGTVGMSSNATAGSWNSGLNLRQQNSTLRLFDGDLIPGTTETGFAPVAAWTGGATKISGIIAAFQSTPVPAVPTVTASAASGISNTNILANGALTSTGNLTITDSGFVWGTSSSPTTANNKVAVGQTTTGNYSAHITGLTASTSYYYRTYATNSMGTSYSTAPGISFTTASSAGGGNTAAFLPFFN
jgi:hypothetical protein